MKFLLDMGVSNSCAKWLANFGHECVHLRNLNLHKLPDDEIIELAKIEGRIILTCDLDFGTLMAASQYALPSVITFRLANLTPASICERLEVILKEISENDFATGIFVTVNERKYRVRRLPI
jgi:predicted nuclease of predicted toxin-antitoxin system